jgi:protein subunit release factor B
VQHNARLEHRLSDTGVDLNDARSHASRHDLALQVLEKDIADSQRAKREADKQLSNAEQERQRLQHQTGELQAIILKSQ